jgi:hypothetical protein
MSSVLVFFFIIASPGNIVTVNFESVTKDHQTKKPALSPNVTLTVTLKHEHQ